MKSNSEYYQRSKKILDEVISEKQNTHVQSKNILDHFPDGFKPRQIQIDLLRQIQNRLSEGFNTLLISAPTGIGKSLIAATIARYFGSSFVVTASKHLQDQYWHDLPFFKPIKGESNFACLKLMESKKIDFEETDFAMKNGLTCDLGPCDMKKIEGGKQTLEKCSFKPSITEIESGTIPENSCFYYLQKYIGLVSPHTIWNYYSFFQMIKFQKKYFEDNLKRTVTIFDEAHRLEDQIIGFAGLEVYRGNLEECRLSADHYDLSDIKMIVELLEDLTRSYAMQIGQTLENRAFQMNPNYEQLERLEKKHERFLHAKNEIKANPRNFVINKPEKDENGIFSSISIKPLDISKHLDSFLISPVRIFMSATIEPASFCENTGMSPSKVAYIEASSSPFPLENRKINFLNVKPLNYATSREDNLEVIRTIDSLLKIHENKRGLILTSSKERCLMIYNNLSEVNKKRIRICHSKNDDDLTVDEILEAHKADPYSVLLSSSLWEGIDLKDDLSRFQIIEKTPFPNLTEKWVKEKSAAYPLWYRSKTLMKLLQGCGRSIRNNTDWAKTYVLDANASRLVSDMKKFVPQAYHDALFPKN
jgi:Rad3-related DNA helicase